jgi:uncharacterized protein (TIGR02145 family)
MKTSLFLLLFSICFFCVGQNINLTFTGTGDATTVDSVIATNLATGQKVTLLGNETLVLPTLTGNTTQKKNNNGIVFPNPFSGQVTFSVYINEPQLVCLRIHDVTGQVISERNNYVLSGKNKFILSVASSGLYLVSLYTEEGTINCKIFCQSSKFGNSIEYKGGVDNQPQDLIKSAQIKYLDYKLGDVILYKCMSGLKNDQVLYTTIITDSPTSSKNYSVNFVACTDAGGKNYSVVKINDQIWMAENLAYLPAVSPPSVNSYSEKHYYVYGYDGVDVKEAKSSINYKTYGVLYNWPAAMNGFPDYNFIPVKAQGSCPVGWHIPSLQELGQLFLNVSIPAEKIKSNTGWLNNKNGNNYSGFNCLPGGLTNGGYYSLGEGAFFWSTAKTETPGTIHAWRMYLGNIASSEYVTTSFGQSVRCVKD